MDNDKVFYSKKYLLNFLEIRDNFLYSDFSSKYKEKIIPKKNGGTRTIKPPCFNLKNVQRKILDSFLSKIPQLPCVYGLSKGKDILNNAKAHQINFDKNLLALDIKDFFPSIPRKSILKIFNKLGFNKKNSAILTKICTINNSLPQGAPTSPYLASMACEKLDKQIYSYCKRKGFIYTRYFDDINISGQNITDKDTKYFEEAIYKYGFISNQFKKKFFNNDDIKIINSVLLNKNTLSVTDNYKEEIKNTYSNFVQNNNITHQRIFAGKFGFYLHINKKEALLFLEEKLKQIN